jgi:hypothetical protein
MSRINIYTINGAKRNGHLAFHYRRVQNRAAAVLDAFDEFGESLSIDLVAHLHRISVAQIRRDLYGDPAEIRKKFGTKSSTKLKNTVNKCIKEINEGVNPALTAVAHNIPFKLIRDIQNNPDIEQVLKEFFSDLNKSKTSEDEENHTSTAFDTTPINVRYFEFIRNRSYFFLQVYSIENISTRSPLASIESQRTIARLNAKRNSNTYLLIFRVIFCRK